MMEKYNIKIVNRNRSTKKETTAIAPENIARAIYGDAIINLVITNGKVENALPWRGNARK